MLISRRIVHGKHSANPSLPLKFPMSDIIETLKLSTHPNSLETEKCSALLEFPYSEFTLVGLLSSVFTSWIVKAYTGTCLLQKV